MTTTHTKQHCSILVGICSGRNYYERRQACRETWLSRPASDIACTFFIGVSDGEPEPDEWSEDMLVLPAPDDYNHLPAKVVAFFRHALEHYDFQWLFKCDDDTYIDLSRLPSLPQEGMDHMGNRMYEHRNEVSGGAGYFLSRTMVEQLVAANDIPPTGAEDVLVTQAVARRQGKIVFTERLYFACDAYPLPDNDLVTAHWCSPLMLRCIHAVNQGEACCAYQGTHPAWQDEVLFYSNHVFRRKTSLCCGEWRWTNDRLLELHWGRWPMDTLIPVGDEFMSRDLKLSPLHGKLSEPDSGTTATRRLNLGGETRDGWLNLPEEDIAHAALPAMPGSVEEVSINVGLERLEASRVCSLVSDAFRVLQPNGLLSLQALDACRTPEAFSPSLLADGSLRSVWTRPMLERLLKEAGFSLQGEPEESGASTCFRANKEVTSATSQPAWGLHVSPCLIPGMRLGNVMFAVAAAYAHAQRTGVSCRVPWNFNESTRMLHDFLGASAPPPTPEGQNEQAAYHEPHFSYHPIPAGITQGGLRGYFQSARYLEDEVEGIRALFAPFIAPRQEGTAGIHIRLGDYKALTHKYRVLDKDFINKAFEHISPEIRRLVLFSDEPSEALSLLSDVLAKRPLSVEIDSHSPCEAIRRMTSMQELILSCSSFSWWGAYLGQQQKALIPGNWFTGQIEDFQDIYLPHWIKL